ncbi:MAG TPA: hypothetical protein VIH89_04250 [Candidatus Sulfotelmatobacter sp.]|jgi:hypothetical protein
MIELKSMAIAMPEVKGHPNRVAFRGVLTVIDTPSQKPPSGSKGHLVVLSKSAAEAALPSLLGMALDYSPSFDRHDVRRKVGVITQADLVGRNLELSGYLFARDFPEVVDEIEKAESGPRNVASSARCPRESSTSSAQTVLANGSNWRHSLSAVAREARAIAAAIRKLGVGRTILSEIDVSAKAEASQLSSSAELGMSYEVTDVEVADTRANIWTLKKVTFTGAAILRRNKAAYRDTWIELSE